MKLLIARIDSKEVNRVLGNAVSYSYGFLKGVDMGQIMFNQMLGEFTAEALKKYIDAEARANPEALHHVYEWGRVGDSGARLFDIDAVASKRVIRFNGKFLQSSSTSGTSDEPFRDKANIMENAIAITIAPTNSDFLVFEDDGETVFTMNEIYIANPGGDAVAGSFGRVVEEFFNVYFTGSLLRQYLSTLSTAEEFSQFFAQGARGGGAATGVAAGTKYITSTGVEIV